MATTTDLGKVMLTNGGEYDPDAVYSERTFVLYRGSTYLSLKTNTGIEPVDDRVNWQLLAQGFAGSEFEIEGYVYVENEELQPPAGEPMLNADKLADQPASYYAPQHEVSDAFSETKSYAVGDYCIYQNALYRFTQSKPAGSWDGAAVVPVTLAQEIQSNAGSIQSNAGSIQTNANAINQINENLTSHVWQLTNKNATSIPAGADMKSDAYKVPGVYVCNTHSKAQSLINSPLPYAFTLLVYKPLNTNDYYVTQEFRTLGNDIARRYFDSSTNKWADDVFYVRQSDMKYYWSLNNNEATEITSGMDMHSVTTPGSYFCRLNDIARSLQNCPLAVAFTMKAYYSNSQTGQYIIQEYTEYTGTTKIMQSYNAATGVWRVTKIVTSDDFSSRTVIGGRGIVTTGSSQPLALYLSTDQKKVVLYLNDVQVGSISYS